MNATSVERYKGPWCTLIYNIKTYHIRWYTLILLSMSKILSPFPTTSLPRRQMWWVCPGGTGGLGHPGSRSPRLESSGITMGFLINLGNTKIAVIRGGHGFSDTWHLPYIWMFRKMGKSQIAISTVRTTSENVRESENMNDLILIKPWFWVKPFGDNPLTQLQPYSIGFQALSELQARDVDLSRPRRTEPNWNKWFRSWELLWSTKSQYFREIRCCGLSTASYIPSDIWSLQYPFLVKPH